MRVTKGTTVGLPEEAKITLGQDTNATLRRGGGIESPAFSTIITTNMIVLRPPSNGLGYM